MRVIRHTGTGETGFDEALARLLADDDAQASAPWFAKFAAAFLVLRERRTAAGRCPAAAWPASATTTPAASACPA